MCANITNVSEASAMGHTTRLRADGHRGTKPRLSTILYTIHKPGPQRIVCPRSNDCGSFGISVILAQNHILLLCFPFFVTEFQVVQMKSKRRLPE